MMDAFTATLQTCDSALGSFRDYRILVLVDSRQAVVMSCSKSEYKHFLIKSV
jgi:hypothetical protein